MRRASLVLLLLLLATAVWFLGLAGDRALPGAGSGQPAGAPTGVSSDQVSAGGGASPRDPSEARRGSGAPDRRALAVAGATRSVGRPLSVRALRAADGEALPGFEVELRRGERACAVAVTDADGIAVLDVDPDLVGTVRAQPRGWVGPVTMFPELDAARLPVATVPLLVPAHGWVEFDPLREGEPATDLLEGWSRTEGRAFEAVDPPPGIAARDRGAQVVRRYAAGDPLRVGPVMLGLRFRCILALQPLGGMQFDDVVDGPLRPGELVTIPLELGPDEGRCLVTVHDHDATPLRHQRVTFLLYAGPPERPAWRPRAERVVRTDADGRAGILLRGLGGEGVVVQRIVAVIDEVRSGTLQVDRFPAAGEDLGVLRLAAPEPEVRGVVLDSGGRPLRGAEVTLVTTGRVGRRPQIGGPAVTDVQGRFELFRTRSSAEAPRVHVVTPAGRFHDHGKVEPGSDIVVRVGGQGAVECTFVDDPGSDGPFPVVELRLGRHPWFHDGRVVRGPGLWRREGLEPATIDVVFRNGAYGEDLATIEDVEIPADGVSADPRLRGLRVARMLRRVELLVVDANDRPFAGARLERPVAGARSSYRNRRESRVSGDDGRLHFDVPADLEVLRLKVEAEDHRTRELALPIEAAHGIQRIELDPHGELRVHVVGLPGGVDPRQVVVEMHPIDRALASLDGFSTRSLDASSACSFPLPQRGRYRLDLLVLWDPSAPTAGMRSREVRGPVVEIGRTAAPFVLRLTERMRSRLEPVGTSDDGSGR